MGDGHNEMACDPIVDMQWDFLERRIKRVIVVLLSEAETHPHEPECTKRLCPFHNISQTGGILKLPWTTGTQRKAYSVTPVWWREKGSHRPPFSIQKANGRPDQLLLCKIVVPKKRRRMVPLMKRSHAIEKWCMHLLFWKKKNDHSDCLH